MFKIEMNAKNAKKKYSYYWHKFEKLLCFAIPLFFKNLNDFFWKNNR